MNTEVLDQKTAACLDYIDKGKKAERAMHTGYALGINKMFEVGCYLEELKKASNRDYLKLLKTHWPELSTTTQHRYRCTYKAIIAKLSTRGKFAGGDVLTAAFEAFDGKTATQIWRELGVIRAKKHQKHTPPRQIEAEEMIESRIEQIKGIAQGALEKLQALRELEAEDIAIMPRDIAEEIINGAVQTAKFYRPLLRSKRKK